MPNPERRPRFHLAFSVHDLTATRGFYGDLLGCAEGRSAEPRVRFQGEVGEQATMFVKDPSGNALEFKAFRHPDQVFAR